jgi:predicted esterase
MLSLALAGCAGNERIEPMSLPAQETGVDETNEETQEHASSGADDDESSGSTTDTFEGTPPSVSISFPTPDVVVSGADVRVEFAVADPDGIAEIVIRVDGEVVAATDTLTDTLPFDATATGSGEHTLEVVARDEPGAQGVASTTIQVSVRGSDGSGGVPGSGDRQATVGTTSRAYYLYVPTTYDEDIPLPLVTVHHGAGGPTNKGETYRDMWLDTAEAGGFVVLAQDSLDDAQGGWLVADRDFWIEATQATLGELNIDTSRVYVWGFSAGGHFGHLLGLTYPESIAAYAVDSGTLGPFNLLGAPAEVPREIPVGIWCGSTDPNRPACELARDTFVAAGWTLDDDLHFAIFDGYHEIPPGHLAEAWAFLSARQLPS